MAWVDIYNGRRKNNKNTIGNKKKVRKKEEYQGRNCVKRWDKQ